MPVRRNSFMHDGTHLLIPFSEELPAVERVVDGGQVRQDGRRGPTESGDVVKLTVGKT